MNPEDMDFDQLLGHVLANEEWDDLAGVYELMDDMADWNVNRSESFYERIRTAYMEFTK